MTTNTVKDFAQELKVPASTLLEQLRAAGIHKSGEADELSDADKSRLLDSLRAERTQAAPRKITVTRKETSVIKQNDASGRAHTIQVEVRRKRVFMKNPQAVAEEEARIAAEAKAAAERRAAEEAAAAERARAEEEARRRAEEEARKKREAEEAARREREEAERRAAAERAEAARRAAEEAKAREEALKKAQQDEAAIKAARREAEKAKLEAEVAQATAQRMEAEAKRRDEARKKAEEEARRIREMMNRKPGVLTAKKPQKEEKPKAAEKPAQAEKKSQQKGAAQRPAAGANAADKKGPRTADSGKKKDKGSRSQGSRWNEDEDRSRRSLKTRGGDEGQSGWRTARGRRSQDRHRQNEPVQQAQEPVVREVQVPETISVADLAHKMSVKATEVIKTLMLMGQMVTINQMLDQDTAMLVVEEMGHKAIAAKADDPEAYLGELAEHQDYPAVPRPPVVTIMGHVDHGKTSLLDAIRKTHVTEGEAGGITQHIGAYTVECNGRMITFIDTPGHEAFTSMRARGAQVTDVVILVVAADDGIMPQTVEAINHSKAAGVPIIVAVNKIDKPESNPERVKQQLTEHGLVCEDWGGDTICVPVSAKKQQNLDELLEMVLLQADVLDLKANPNKAAKGTIIEAQLDKGRGPVATVLVQNGTLKIGDPIVAGIAYGRVRAMMNDRGENVKTAGPSCPVEVLGFNEVPSAGDIMNVAEVSKKVAEERRNRIKAEQLKNLSKVSLEDLFSHIAEGEVKTLNIVVKADVHGSVEAVKQALEKLSNEEVRVKCIHGGVGAITESDVMFASASNAIVIGFNVRPDSGARNLAEQEKVDVRTYRIIYQAIEDVENAMKGMFKPVFKEVHLGTISVRNTFKVSSVGTIAGAYVQDGKVQRNAQIRVVRDGVVIHEGQIASLRRFKDDVREVAAGYECGIGIENFNDIHEGDVIEAYAMEEVKR